MLKYLEKKVYVITKITISKETVKTSKIASLYYHHRHHRNQLATKKHRNFNKIFSSHLLQFFYLQRLFYDAQRKELSN